MLTPKEKLELYIKCLELVTKRYPSTSDEGWFEESDYIFDELIERYDEWKN